MARKTYSFEGCSIHFKNFSGEPGRFNPAGKRSFALRLTEEEADKLEREGWNIKRREPREEGDDWFIYTNVNVNMDSKWPPRIRFAPGHWEGDELVLEAPLTDMDADTVGMLDSLRIIDCSCTLNAVEWEIQGNHGTKGYLQSMIAIFQSDPIEARYRFEEPAGEEVPF